MSIPPEHAALLRRTAYPVHPAAVLDDRERELLSRYGYWLEALADGALPPSTPDQVRFVCAARGEAEPQSVFEKAWAKQQRAVGPSQPPVGPMELAERLTLVGLGSETHFHCPLNQYVIADALGLSAIHVNRVLRQLRQQNLLTVRAGEVQIDDIEALGRLAGYHGMDPGRTNPG